MGGIRCLSTPSVTEKNAARDRSERKIVVLATGGEIGRLWFRTVVTTALPSLRSLVGLAGAGLFRIEDEEFEGDYIGHVSFLAVLIVPRTGLDPSLDVHLAA